MEKQETNPPSFGRDSWLRRKLADPSLGIVVGIADTLRVLYLIMAHNVPLERAFGSLVVPMGIILGGVFMLLDRSRSTSPPPA